MHKSDFTSNDHFNHDTHHQSALTTKFTCVKGGKTFGQQTFWAFMLQTLRQQTIKWQQ